MDSQNEQNPTPDATATPECDELVSEGRAHYMSLALARSLEKRLTAAKAEIARLGQNLAAIETAGGDEGASARMAMETVQLRARVAELDTENCRLINKVDVQAVELYKLEQDKARLIAVVIPHIDDLRGTALALVRAGYASTLKNTIAEIEKAADELRAAIDAARAGKGAT